MTLPPILTDALIIHIERAIGNLGTVGAIIAEGHDDILVHRHLSVAFDRHRARQR